MLAIGINLMLLRMFQMDRMPLWYVAVGIAAILLLGQIAVFAPTLRFSAVRAFARMFKRDADRDDGPRVDVRKKAGAAVPRPRVPLRRR